MSNEIEEKNTKKNDSGIFVFVEQLEGKLAPVSLELIGKATELASDLGCSVSTFLIGDNVSHIVPTLFHYGSDKVYIIDSPEYHYYRVEPYNLASCYLVEKYKPEILLIGATTTGRDLAGAMATTLKTGLTADCTILEIDMEKKILLASRPAFGGNIMATIVCLNHRPQMATVRPRVMKMPQIDTSRTGIEIKESIPIDEKSLKTIVLEIVKETGSNVKIEDAKIIVSGGRGVQSPENFKLISELADVLGGVVGGSRGAVEKSLVDYAHQVGQTGKTVSPNIYFAIGISGAVQHTVGMTGSETIVAINTDPECNMMKLATYGIVGDATVVLPKLIEEFKKVLKSVNI